MGICSPLHRRVEEDRTKWSEGKGICLQDFMGVMEGGTVSVWLYISAW
jgi:hypothetical protein